MLSRVANAIYWMGRYLERAENVARFIDVNLNLMLDQQSAAEGQWAPLVLITGDDALFDERYNEASQENVIRFLSFDAHNPNSILSCLRTARENARSVREIISSEMWEQANRFYHMVKEAANSDNSMALPDDFYTQVKTASHLFSGIADGTMSHGEAWHFLRMGRLLERADKTSRLLDVKYFILLPEVSDVGAVLDNIQWAALLKSASANEMYRKRYRQISPMRIVEFLVLDHEFPRSVQYCVNVAEQSLHAISGAPLNAFSNAAEQRLGRLSSELRYAQIDEIISAGLHEYMDNLQRKINRIDDAIYETFFALRPLAAKLR